MSIPNDYKEPKFAVGQLVTAHWTGGHAITGKVVASTYIGGNQPQELYLYVSPGVQFILNPGRDGLRDVQWFEVLAPAEPIGNYAVVIDSRNTVWVRVRSEWHQVGTPNARRNWESIGHNIERVVWSGE